MSTPDRVPGFARGRTSGFERWADQVVKPIGECHDGEVIRLFYNRFPEHLQAQFLVVKVQPAVPLRHKVIVTMRRWDQSHFCWKPELIMMTQLANEPVVIIEELGGGIQC